MNCRRMLTRGGATSAYSSVIHQRCGEEFETILKTPSPIKFEPHDLIVLSDGSCGGECGVFVSLLQYTKKAKIVTIGGIYTQPMDAASFKGASGMTYKELQEINNFYKLTCPLNDPIQVRKNKKNNNLI